MSNKSIVALVLVAFTLVGVGSSAYIIDEREKAIKLKFGEVVNPDITPGLHWKIPFVHTIRKFDARVITLDAKAERFFTEEKKTLIVDAFIQWKIVDVQKFYTATSGDMRNANNFLSSRVNEGLRNAFGVRSLHEVVSGQRDELMENLKVEMAADTRADLGIEVLDIRIKGIDLPQEVSSNVYTRMIAERQKEAAKLRSNGEKEAQIIRADADRQKTIIEAEGYSQSEAIRGEGDGEAASIYNGAFTQDSEFYSFTRSLTAYEESLGGDDIMVVSPDSDFFRYLKDSKGVREVKEVVE
jgi:modulator of FtsH protease HflC